MTSIARCSTRRLAALAIAAISLIREHLGKIVRGSVEETLNALLDAEADRLCNAGRYERTEARTRGPGRTSAACTRGRRAAAS